MKRPNLKKMTLDQLTALRDEIQGHMASMRGDLLKQLAALGDHTGATKNGRKRSSSLKGRKVAPKYRNPKNLSETWAGRGATPRWLKALLKQGKKLESFAIKR